MWEKELIINPRGLAMFYFVYILKSNRRICLTLLRTNRKQLRVRRAILFILHYFLICHHFGVCFFFKPSKTLNFWTQEKQLTIVKNSYVSQTLLWYFSQFDLDRWKGNTNISHKVISLDFYEHTHAASRVILHGSLAAFNC